MRPPVRSNALSRRSGVPADNQTQFRIAIFSALVGLIGALIGSLFGFLGASTIASRQIEASLFISRQNIVDEQKRDAFSAFLRDEATLASLETTFETTASAVPTHQQAQAFSDKAFPAFTTLQADQTLQSLYSSDDVDTTGLRVLRRHVTYLRHLVGTASADPDEAALSRRSLKADSASLNSAEAAYQVAIRHELLPTLDLR